MLWLKTSMGVLYRLSDRVTRVQAVAVGVECVVWEANESEPRGEEAVIRTP